MGKRRKRLTLDRYAKKYAKKRAALGFSVGKVQETVKEAVSEAVETVLEAAVDVAEKVEEVLDQTQERVNALRFINEEEIIQVEEPKVESQRPQGKRLRQRKRKLLLQRVKDEPPKLKQTPRLFVPSNN